MNTNQDSAVYSRRGRRLRTSGGGGVVLILIGLVALAWTQGFVQIDLRSMLPNFDMERIWPGFNWGLAWPVFLLIPAILLLATAAIAADPQQRAEKLRTGTVLVALSAFFFASAWGLITLDLWPVLLVIAGGLMLFRPGAARSAL